MKNILIRSLLICCMLFSVPSLTHASLPGDMDMHGWAWSWTTGWIKLSSKKINSSTGALLGGDDNAIIYGVSFNAGTNLASGWAWSSNVGWISFNQSDLALAPACAGPGGGAPVPAQLVVDTATGGYKLIGTARAISPTQSANGWNQVSANGNWNGCIYLHQDATAVPPVASMPSNPCNVKFGVKFAPFGTDYVGSGQAWNAAGPFNPAGSCASPLGFGGLSFIEFAGTFKSILKQNAPSLAINMSAVGWTPECKNTDGSNITSKSVTVNYTVTPAAGTSCTWYIDGLAQGPVSPLPTGSQPFTVTPNSSGVVISMRCHNPGSSYPDPSNPLIATLAPLTCAQCSDWLDNNSVNGIDQADPACHEQCKLTQPYHPESSPEGAGPFCSAQSQKGLPKLKEN